MFKVWPLVLILFVSTVSMRAASDYYLKIDGIDGEITDGDMKGATLLQAFSWDIVSPRDHASGLPTGKRQHKPITFVKTIDKASPLLFQALCKGEHFKEVKLTMRRMGATGKPETYYTITLTDVMVSSISLGGGDNGSSGNGVDNTDAQERISFTYQKITMSSIDGSTESMDDWETPSR